MVNDFVGALKKVYIYKAFTYNRIIYRNQYNKHQISQWLYYFTKYLLIYKIYLPWAVFSFHMNKNNAHLEALERIMDFRCLSERATSRECIYYNT